MGPVVRNELETLLALRERPWWRLRFPDPLESRYRDSMRRQLRWMRTLLLFSIGLGFAVAPLQEAAVFRPPEELKGTSRLFALGVPPVAWAAALLTWSSGPHELTKGVQSAAIIATLGSVLFLRWLGITTDFQYPPGMLSVTGLAIAIFGGFGWYRLLIAFTVFFSLGITQEFMFSEVADGSAFRSAYVLSFSFIIAVLGSLTGEVLRRQNWVQRELATALARTDMLTGLSNRADAERRFQMTLDQARRDRKNIAVLVLDIDRFKEVNDRHGHATGDRALRAVAEAVEASSAHRPLDVKARTGGDEFVIVWYDAPPDALPALVNRVMDAVRAIRLDKQGQGEPLGITASVGACWTVPEKETTAQALVHFADALMYRAKRKGRDQACIEEFPGSSK